MNAIFQIEDRDIPPIEIQCNADWKMSQVFEKFKNKATYLELNDFSFYYNGTKINKDLTVAQIKNNQNSSFIIITAKKRTKIMKCPLCVSNTCYIKIENYGLKFSGCRYNHEIAKTFDDYESSQKIDYEQIKCDICRNTQKKDLKDFYKCLKCSEEFKRSEYFCEKCIKVHALNDGEEHKSIKYDEKYYICQKHYNEYSSHCIKCKYDLCEVCEKNHKGKEHDIIKYDSIALKTKIIRKELEEIKKRTAKAKSHIDQIRRMIDDAVNILDNYYIICMDIIGKYELYNSRQRNYHVLQTLNSIPESNKKILEDLDKFLMGNKSKNDYLNKCKILIDIFTSDREKYIGGIAVENKNMEKDAFLIQNEIKKIENVTEEKEEKNEIETASHNNYNDQYKDNQNNQQLKKKKKIKNI